MISLSPVLNQTVVSASALAPFNTSVSTIPLNVLSVPTVASVISPSLSSVVSLVPSVVAYPDVNQDKNLRKDVTDYIYDKIVNNWLKYNYLGLYKLFVVENGKVRLVKSFEEADKNSKSDNTENMKKYEYMIINYFERSDISKLLDKFRKKYGINWWDIKKKSDNFRSYLEKRVLSFIYKQIKSELY